MNRKYVCLAPVEDDVTHLDRVYDIVVYHDGANPLDLHMSEKIGIDYFRELAGTPERLGSTVKRVCEYDIQGNTLQAASAGKGEFSGFVIIAMCDWEPV